jgi:hypothetical protein
MFVKNKNFAATIAGLQDDLSEHPDYVKTTAVVDDGWLSCEFRSTQDPSRIVQVAVMLYHFPD